jgi:hypothetical protein
MRSLAAYASVVQKVLIELIAGFAVAVGQLPVGTISGLVEDPAGAAIVNAEIIVRQTGTGFERKLNTKADGTYRVDNLQPGTYEIEANCQGFRAAWRRVTVQVGDYITVNFEPQPGLTEQKVEIRGEISGINRADYKVDGSVNRLQVENLPLNGRGFLELAQLEPGVDVESVTNPGAYGNNYQRVSIAGAWFSQGRISIDGASVNDQVSGGTMQSVSQESVQEFQISSFNFDPSTGVTGSGAINIVSRRGGNDLHGAAFFYYRDDHLAAYPGLRRDPRNADPFFARRQSGFNLSGPIHRDRLFWFANYEHNNQDGVFSITNNHPIFSKLDLIYKNPLNSDQFNLRLDWRINDRHQSFSRISLDKNDTLAPAAAVGMPSNWQSSHNKAIQAQGGLISVLASQMINDLRLSYSYLGGYLDPVSSNECRDPTACIGVDEANILVFDAPQFRLGKQFNVPLRRFPRTYQIVDNLTWQHGDHRLRFGGDWRHMYLKSYWAFIEPAQVTLWGPSNLQTQALRPLYDALPASLKDPAARPPTLQEILQLPLRYFTTGIGDPSLPGPFNFDDASRNDELRFYAQDAWQVRSNLTISYGLAYTIETNLYNADLDRPAYLAPLLGDDLRPPRKGTRFFDPSFGLAWSLGKNQGTVIRGGAGIYHDQFFFAYKARERAYVGPSGNGRVAVDGSITGLNFLSTPTEFRGQDLLPLLASIRSEISSKLGNGSDLSMRGVEVIKQGDSIFDPDHTTAYAIHITAGVQRQLLPNLVLSADYVMRRYVHVGGFQGVFILDRNRFNRPKVTGVDQGTGVVTFVRDPVIPICTPLQASALDPKDNCSAGPISVYASGGNYRYQGLHLNLEKRYSSGLQFTLGYALTKHTGFNYLEFNNYNDYSEAYGNVGDHRRHRLTASGVWTLRDYRGDSLVLRGLLNTWTVSFISQTNSSPPRNTILNGLDLDGDGISRTLLPGTTQNSLGRGLSDSELRALVAEYNADVEARTRRVANPDGSVAVIRPRTPFNQIISPIALPDRFSSGDSFLSQDIRLTRMIRIRDRVQLSLIGEVFNIFNIANLTGYSDVLNQPNYGQPSARVGQVFGAGGPRAFQFAARFAF